MGATFTRVKTWADEILTASDLNAEFDNILDNLDTAGVDDSSTNAAAMQTTADPYPSSVASLATSLQGELHRLRYQVAQMHQQTYWYYDPGNIYRKNFLINGLGQVNQRVTAYTLVKDAYGVCADRWYGMATGTLVSAGTLTTVTSSSVGRTGYAIRFSGVTLTGTGVLYLRYRMEAGDALTFKNQTASFSCNVRHDVGSAINYTVYIRKADAADDFSAVTAISNNSATSVSSATNTAVTYAGIAMGDCSNGIEIEIKVEPGAITTKLFDFTELQFEVSGVVTPYDYRPFEHDYALARRYYQKSYAYATATGTDTQLGWECLILGYANNGFHYIFNRLPAPMRTTPTISYWDKAGNASKVSTFIADGTRTDNVTPSATPTDIADTGFSIGHSAAIAGIAFHWQAVAEL